MGLTAVVLLVAILPAVVVAPHDPPPSPTVGSVLAGTSSPANNSDLNNTSSRLGEAIGALVDWFVDGLEKVVALVILLLLVGGVVNYVVVGRHRGVWTPAEAVRTGSPPAPSGPPATNGPPAGPERPP